MRRWGLAGVRDRARPVFGVCRVADLRGCVRGRSQSPLYQAFDRSRHLSATVGGAARGPPANCFARMPAGAKMTIDRTYRKASDDNRVESPLRVSSERFHRPWGCPLTKNRTNHCWGLCHAAGASASAAAPPPTPSRAARRAPSSPTRPAGRPPPRPRTPPTGRRGTPRRIARGSRPSPSACRAGGRRAGAGRGRAASRPKSDEPSFSIRPTSMSPSVRVSNPFARRTRDRNRRRRRRLSSPAPPPKYRRPM